MRRLNADIVAGLVRELPIKTLTVDVDGSVISTGLTVERAFRGFNPHLSFARTSSGVENEPTDLVNLAVVGDLLDACLVSRRDTRPNAIRRRRVDLGLGRGSRILVQGE